MCVEVLLERYLKAAVRVMIYELALAAQLYFEMIVFKPASNNAKIQQQLGLEMV